MKNSSSKSLPNLCHAQKWLFSWLNPWNSFINSPNFVWFVVAITTYVVFPYDLEAASKISFDGLGKQFIYRSCVDLFIMLTYFGFWYVHRQNRVKCMQREHAR